jgi:hypothetical protein
MLAEARRSSRARPPNRTPANRRERLTTPKSAMPRAKRQRVVVEEEAHAIETVCPRVNRAFLEELMTYEEFHQTQWWGDICFAEIFNEILQNDKMKDRWCESDFATRCGVALRLIPANFSALHRPTYSMPKLIRFAALCGTEYLELDLVASHPRQILKYAREHQLPHAALARAFGGREAIRSFRSQIAEDMAIRYPEASPWSSEDIKVALNQICYGGSLREWAAQKHIVGGLPPALTGIKDEVAHVIEHVARNADGRRIWEACLSRERPKLAALSVMCQMRERADLDACVAMLPPQATVMGYLNDSVLCAPFDDVGHYIESMEAREGILIESKWIPSTAEEYEAYFVKRTGHEINKTYVSGRRLETVRARSNAMRWLLNQGSDVCPHVSFVLGMESELPVTFNVSTGKTEYYDEAEGHWVRDMAPGALTGKPISDLLKKTYFRVGMQYEQDGRGKMRLAPRRLTAHCQNLFENTSFMSCITTVAVHHRGPHKALDSGAAHLLVFKDRVCFDFAMKAPHPSMEKLIRHIPETPEKQHLRELLKPLRELSMRDRNTQAMPHSWKLYHRWREGLVMVRLLQEVEEMALVDETGVPLADGTNNIGEALSSAIKAEATKHDCFRKCFLEPFNYNIHEAVQSIKMFANAWNTKSYKRTEVVTIFDIGEGSTGKGTLKHLADTYGGIRTKTGAGYSATITAQALQQKTSVSEAPSEQLANFEGARVVFLDEAPTGDDARAMHMKVIHMIMSGNFITAARKFASESVFLFLGTLYLVCNGYWKSDQPLGGPDERRITGQEYCVKFVNKPEAELLPCELVKDGSIKSNIASFCPELSFWVLAYFYIKQAGEEADVTLPRPPSAVAFRNHVFKKDNVEEQTVVVEQFIAERLVVYSTSAKLPTTAQEVTTALMDYASSRGQNISENDARNILRERGYSSRNLNIPGHGARKARNVRALVTMKKTALGDMPDKIWTCEVPRAQAG